MSERIRNIREALRSGFDTQIAIGEKAFGLAEQRESRNFQMALEARRERLQRELQTERLKSQEQIAERGIEARAEAAEKLQQFQLSENQRDRAFKAGQAREQAARDMDIRMFDREMQKQISDAKLKWEADSMSIKRLWEMSDNKVEAQQKSDDILATYLGTLNDTREKLIDKLAQSDLPEETKSSLTEQLNFVSAQIQQGEKDLGLGLEVIISRLKVDPFVEALAVDEDSIASAKAYLDDPSKETELYKRIEKMVNDSGVEVIGESKDEFIKRVALGVAGSSLDKGAPDAAPTPDETPVVPDLNAQTTGRVDPRSGDPVDFVPNLAQNLFPGIFGSPDRSGLDPSQIPQPMNIVMGWQKSGYTNAQIQGMLKQMIETESLPEEQLPLWNELLRIFTIVNEQSGQQTGMMNPQGGLLSQQPMMAMQSDMTQGDIDYFSPDAINARLSGMV